MGEQYRHWKLIYNLFKVVYLNPFLLVIYYVYYYKLKIIISKFKCLDRIKFILIFLEKNILFVNFFYTKIINLIHLYDCLSVSI